MNELHPSKGGKFQLSHIRRYIEYFLEQQTQRREYVKHQKALRGIEQLLLKTGSISKINESDTDTEIETIMESGLTKDITSFRLDGFQFYGKIIGKDKIVGDTFGSQREGSKTLFYF
jgi:ribonucleotide reductase alpha subunit